MTELNREDGIQAVIELQALVGIEESPEDAGKGWDALQDWEQEATMKAHSLMCPQEITNDSAE